MTDVRRGRGLLISGGVVAVASIVGALLWVRWAGRDQGEAVSSPAVQLDMMEQESLRCEPANEPVSVATTSSAPTGGAEVLPPPWPAASRPQERRRFVLAQVRRLLRDGVAEAALELLDREARADGSIVDPAWRSMRMTVLRWLDRDEEAERECAQWRESLDALDPHRSWAEAEWSLHLALVGRLTDAAAVSEPWLGRTLTPAPMARFRLAEAILRSERGDHAVASAAFAGARLIDRSAEPRARIVCSLLVEIARQLASAALVDGAAQAAAEVAEQGLELVDAGPARHELLRLLATASRAEAARLLESIPTAANPDDDGADASQLSRIERANRAFLRAASAAQELSERLTLDARGETPALRAAALDLAAECWERAGRVDAAVTAWRAWLQSRPDSDPLRAEVLWRIAELQHGLGRFMEAADAYRMLIRVHPNSPQAARAPVAAARALRALGESGHAAELLDGVLSGRGGISPESPAFILALIERGRLAHEQRDWRTAQQRLEEALRRDALRADRVELALLLADSWRGLALDRERLAAEPAPPSDRAATASQALEAWAEAASLFAGAVAWLDARDGETTSPVHELWSRWARVGLASSLEALGRADEAIVAWEEVDRRHPLTEASLLALDRLGRLRVPEDPAIRRRAQRRLESIPRDSIDGAPWILSQEEWRLWFGHREQVVAHRSGGSS